MSQISQLTLRNFDPRVANEIRRLAKEMRISLNQAAQLLLKRWAGIQEPKHDAKKIGNALDRYFGGMSAKEAKEIDAAVKWGRRCDWMAPRSQPTISGLPRIASNSAPS
jgi:hypothetical protein